MKSRHFFEKISLVTRSSRSDIVKSRSVREVLSKSFLSTLVASSFVLLSCSPHEQSNLASGFSRSELKRFDSSQFSEVVRKIFYGGFTVPVVTLPRGAERGVLIFENGQVSKDFLDFEKLAKRLGQKLTIPENAQLADHTLVDILQFYREQFGRNSYDGKGSTIQMTIDVNRNTKVLTMFGENAAWIAEKNLFFFGAGGNGFKSFITSKDVAAHEFTHAVISSTSNLEYAGQSGALNEHFADLFGEMFQASQEEKEPSFLIGETLSSGELAPMRNMLEPALGLSPQPGHMSEIAAEFSGDCIPSGTNDRCGVHILSGIPNKFASLVVKQLGWLKVRDLFYALMTEKLTSQANFSDYAAEARKMAAEVLSEEDANIIDKSLISVGL